MIHHISAAIFVSFLFFLTGMTPKDLKSWQKDKYQPPRYFFCFLEKKKKKENKRDQCCSRIDGVDDALSFIAFKILKDAIAYTFILRWSRFI